MKAPNHYVQFTHETTADSTRYTFATGIILTANIHNGNGSIEYPATDDLGAISFPVRNHGDVFHSLRNGAIASTIPAHCKAW